MKVLKFSLIFGLVIVVGAYFNTTTAQIFENNETGRTLPVSAEQKLVVDLLKQEIANNKAFEPYKKIIEKELDEASFKDELEKDCYKYSPLLVEAVNAKAEFIKFFSMPGNIGYIFETNKGNEKITKTFLFHEQYEEDEFSNLLSLVGVRINGSEQKIDDPDKYIINNYCNPLNQILNQNTDKSIPQLLEILKQRFSK